jgi:hypothetical protein
MKKRHIFYAFGITFMLNYTDVLLNSNENVTQFIHENMSVFNEQIILKEMTSM